MSARKTNQSSQVLSCKHAPFVFNHTLSTSFSKHSFKLIADLISITSYCQLISSIFLSFCHISRYISSHIFSHQVGFERLLTEHSKLMWIHTRASNTNTNHLVRELNMYMYEIYIHIQNCFFVIICCAILKYQLYCIVIKWSGIYHSLWSQETTGSCQSWVRTPSQVLDVSLRFFLTLIVLYWLVTGTESSVIHNWAKINWGTYGKFI